jgi:hypothetical protein
MIMRDFPLNELTTATEVEHITFWLENSFEKFKANSKKNSSYPISRYVRLLEAISRDMSGKLLYILQRKRIMHLDYEDFIV